MDHSDFLPLVEQYIRPVLGPKVANQFVRAIEKPLDEFNDRFLWRHLSHICISDTVRETGRTHLLAHEIRDQGVEEWSNYRRQLTYWTNTMVMAEKYVGADGKERWVEPSRRVIGGFPYVFTIEFDVGDVEFLKTQMSWCRSSGKPLDAPLGGVYRELSSYADFQGITACWSGNKSLHLHVMFDSYPVIEATKLDRRNMRQGFIDHWSGLVTRVKALLGVVADIEPDAALRLPEAFRRLPWGTRVLDKENIVGMPVGSSVPQITLWEQYRDRRDPKADVLFFQPQRFLATAGRSEQQRDRGVGVGSGSALRPGPLCEADRLLCETRLRETCQKLWGPYPKLYRLEWSGGHWVASFYNSTHDSRASSIIRDDFAHLMMCGRDAWKDRSPSPLPFRLGVLMGLWLKQAKSCHDTGIMTPTATPEPDHTITWIDPVADRELTEVERAFQDGAVTRDVVSDLCRKAIRETVRRYHFAYIKGPEGGGKTRGVMAEHHRIIGDMGATGSDMLSMYAFNNYSAAEEKAREFNAVQNQQGYHAVVIRGWEAEYQAVCRRLKIAPGSAEQALEDGYPSLPAWVEDNQPKALKELQRRHAAVWEEIGSRRPVFMSSHAVMQYWTTASHTRMFWHREYWLAKTKDEARMHRLKKDMQLVLAVYDEVSWGCLLEAHRDAEIAWVEGLRRQDPRVWGRRGKVQDRYEAWSSYRDLVPLPRDPDGVEIEIDFRTCQRIAQGGGRGREWRDIEVVDHGEYETAAERRVGVGVADNDNDTNTDTGLVSIYSARVGQRWKVRPRSWWASLAKRTVVLTTEVLPTLIASSLPEVTPLGFRERRVGWHVVELETPSLPRDEIRVEFDRRVTATGVAGVVERFRKRHGEDITVITNKGREIEATINHTRARGSNDLREERLAQVMLHMSPAEHEIHEVLNGYLATNVCCRLRHVDQMNQSAGRNLGFRKPSDTARHWLLMSPSLWLKIDEVLCQHSRYDLRLCFSDGALSEIRRKQNVRQGVLEGPSVKSGFDMVKDLLKYSNQNLPKEKAS